MLIKKRKLNTVFFSVPQTTKFISDTRCSDKKISQVTTYPNFNKDDRLLCK